MKRNETRFWKVCKLLKMVARDGIEGHYAILTMPLTGIRLNPAA